MMISRSMAFRYSGRFDGSASMTGSAIMADAGAATDAMVLAPAEPGHGAGVAGAANGYAPAPTDGAVDGAAAASSGAAITGAGAAAGTTLAPFSARSCTWITPSLAKASARSRMFSSSRTLPGKE